MALNAVDQVLAKMIHNWPTLYPNRLAALKHVFEDGAEWYDNGTVWLMSLDGQSDSLTDDEDAVAASATEYLNSLPDTPEYRRTRERTDAKARLEVRQRNAKYMFIRENAELIATAECRFDTVPRFSLSGLNKIPLEKLTPEWKEALVEFCRAIQYFSPRDMERIKVSMGDNIEYTSRLEEARKTASECLMRLDPEGEGKHARNAEIDRIRREAEKYGYTLKLIPV